MKKYNVTPPFGYNFTDNTNTMITDVNGLKDLVSNLSDDEDFQFALNNMPENSMADYCKRILELNGFEVKYIK